MISGYYLLQRRKELAWNHGITPENIKLCKITAGGLYGLYFSINNVTNIAKYVIIKKHRQSNIGHRFIDY